MNRVRSALTLPVTAMLAVTTVWIGSNADRDADASTATYERLDTNDPHALAVDIATQIAGGTVQGLTDLIITTSEEPTDAIISAGLASYLDTCPRPDNQVCNRTATLLTQADAVPQVTAEAIQATGVPADRITIIGGIEAVSDQVRDQIAAAAGWNGQGTNPVVRVAGNTRYDTAAALATHITGLSQQPRGIPLAASYRTVIVATGLHPADALAASTLAYRGQHLLLLSPPSAPPTALDTAIRALNAHCALVVGGTNALANTVHDHLDDALATAGTGACRTERIAGSDRHHTATLIATRLTDHGGTPATALIANPSVSNIPLTAAPLARSNATLLYTPADQLDPTTRDWLDRHPTIARITIIGNRTTITPQTVSRALDTTITAPVVGSGGGGAGGGGGFALSYATTEFDTALTSQVLSPTITGGTGPFTYAVTNGALPTGVTFDTTTGGFTGPSTWNLGFVTVSTGHTHSCAILTDTTARCWGNGGDGQVGDGTQTQHRHPVAVLASGTQASNPVTLSGITQISTDVSHTCAVLADTTARCWGLNLYGQLGDGTTVFQIPNPVAVLASGTQASNPVTLSGITQISVGRYNTCVLLADTTARCWGINGRGQLGDGTTTARQAPVAVLGSGTQASNPVTLSGIAQITTGHMTGGGSSDEHACALMLDSTVRCWGDNQQGQLGNGTTSPSRQLNPVVVLASGTQASSPVTLSGVTQITAGLRYTCAVMNDATARCWGLGGYGQLGDGTATNRSNPVAVLASGTQASSPVTLSGITRISARAQLTCAILADTTARCFGDNANGIRGNGLGTNSNSPTTVLASGTEASSPVTLSGITSIDPSEYHTCAALADGGGRCWGYNWYGMLGDGTDSTTRLNPVRVLAAGTEASNPVLLGGQISLAPTTVTIEVTDSTGATTTATVTLTSR